MVDENVRGYNLGSGKDFLTKTWNLEARTDNLKTNASVHTQWKTT